MTTYAQLQADFPLWMKRTDLGTSLSGFVALFESRVGRRLRVRGMETAFTGTINASNKIALPANFLAFKTLWAGSNDCTLKAQSLESLVDRRQVTGTPTLYAIDGISARFNGTGSVAGVYFAAVPGLVASGTNWLSVLAYDAYLFGALAEGELYSLNPQAAATYTARAESILADIAATDVRDRFSGPLVSRVR